MKEEEKDIKIMIDYLEKEIINDTVGDEEKKINKRMIENLKLTLKNGRNLGKLK